MPKYTAFISDLDGTLVNSEPQHFEAWMIVMSSYGLHYDHHWFDQYVGTSDSLLAKDLINENQLDASARTLQKQKESHFHEIIREKGQLFPGILEALAKIHSKYPVAIGTNSGRKDAEVVFDATGLRPYAGVSVTADDVEHMKPAADIFLRAADLLKVPINECIVCEDSPAGVKAGKAAGCYVIGITSSQSAERLSLADEIFDSNAAALARVYDLLSEA